MAERVPATRRAQLAMLRRVASAALCAYGITPASLALLHHAYNTTFTVTTAEGARAVLHILRPVDAELPDETRRLRVESELWWLEQVRHDLGPVVPTPLRTPAGAGAVSVRLEGAGPARLCTLTRWVDGRFVRARLLPGHLAAVGRLTARLHVGSAQLQVPDWFDRPPVDRADAELEEEVARLFHEQVAPEAARVVRRVLGRARRAQDRLGGDPDVRGLIHADVHQGNFLFDHRDVRLIDFGDCGWGHYLYDLAVTLSEAARFPGFHPLRAALLAGYREVRDLPEEQAAMIDDFVLLREVQNLAWFVAAQDDPQYRERATRVGQGVAAIARQLDAR